MSSELLLIYILLWYRCVSFLLTTTYTYQNRDHNSKIDKIIEQHHAKLDVLSSDAVNAANELDAKLHTIQQQMKEKKIYLSRANELLSSRYNAS